MSFKTKYNGILKDFNLFTLDNKTILKLIDLKVYIKSNPKIVIEDKTYFRHNKSIICYEVIYNDTTYIINPIILDEIFESISSLISRNDFSSRYKIERIKRWIYTEESDDLIIKKLQNQRKKIIKKASFRSISDYIKYKDFTYFKNNHFKEVFIKNIINHNKTIEYYLKNESVSIRMLKEGGEEDLYYKEDKGLFDYNNKITLYWLNYYNTEKIESYILNKINDIKCEPILIYEQVVLIDYLRQKYLEVNFSDEELISFIKIIKQNNLSYKLEKELKTLKKIILSDSMQYDNASDRAKLIHVISKSSIGSIRNQIDKHSKGFGREVVDNNKEIVEKYFN